MNEWARGVGHGITSDRGLGRRSPPDLHSLTKNTSLGHKDRDILQLDTRAAALRMQSYGRSYFCLLNVIFGCVSTEISIQFSTRSFPNRIEYYRKRGTASYIVREVLSVRERERYRQRERDGSDVTIVSPFAERSPWWR